MPAPRCARRRRTGRRGSRAAQDAVGLRPGLEPAAVEGEHERPRREGDVLLADEAHELVELDRLVAGVVEQRHLACERVGLDAAVEQDGDACAGGRGGGPPLSIGGRQLHARRRHRLPRAPFLGIAAARRQAQSGGPEPPFHLATSRAKLPRRQWGQTPLRGRRDPRPPVAVEMRDAAPGLWVVGVDRGIGSSWLRLGAAGPANSAGWGSGDAAGAAGRERRRPVCCGFLHGTGESGRSLRAIAAETAHKRRLELCSSRSSTRFI